MGHHIEIVPARQLAPAASHKGASRKKNSDEREDLYIQYHPKVKSFLILVHPVVIKDEPPGGEEILVSVRGLCTGRAGGLQGVQAEYMKEWIQEATKENDPIP